ncbi:MULTISPECIES: helix-turn-helix transcriptional regulator [Enterobacteriaceae]|uniref:helix-turn-helix transcriptional regulator n=1 Tax=Enterobacteriaceae TaxID=543 RepID=UPI000F7E4075|nr:MULTISPECIES: addiction module antidote protein, HigA family [Enterobacteriaceae]MDF3828881.1 addiction module antidote protein, HigA family [Pseudocitrobacter sp. 2023EL-00150]RTD79702.1 addiction module antidote protein, HigA family [Klebsiella quasipneumoniae subsp. similipneumoniae]
MRQYTVSHPGVIIARDLADMGKSAQSFVNETQIAAEFLEGKLSLTAGMAVHIAALMGGTPEFWMRLQYMYDLHQQKLKAERRK